MHSRIYQISTEPIDKVDYIEESHYWDHWFTNSVADYVNGDTDRVGDIKWLKDCYESRGVSFGTDDNGEYFIVTDKLRYFTPKFEEFKNVLKEISKVAIDDFISDAFGLPMYKLESAYDEKFGFYIDWDDDLLTLDDFIRCAEVGTKYYIGATIDYHC